MGGLDFFSLVQQAVAALLNTYEPEFLRYSQTMFIYLATIMIAYTGIELLFTSAAPNDKMWTFVKLMLFISFGYSLVFFYMTPIPGAGVSFTHLITDQMNYFSRTLDVSSVRKVYEHLDALFNAFVAPGAWEIIGALIYLVLVVFMIIAKALTIGVVAFGLISSAVLVLLGPIFVPFFIVPPLDFLFWGWFRALLQYSFVPVVAYAFLMVFDTFIYAVLTGIPRGITADLYTLYAFNILGFVMAFGYSLFHVPALAASIMSGHSHGGPNLFLRFSRA
jgi:type IV secretory pathway VirB6-like protein